MSSADRRSFNNADLTPVQVAGFKKKATKVAGFDIKLLRRKVALSIDAHVLFDGKSTFAFLSLPAMNVVLTNRADGSYRPIDPAERDDALKALRSVRGGGSKGLPSSAVMPGQLASALKMIPKGYKLVLKDGSYELVKSRTRAKK